MLEVLNMRIRVDVNFRQSIGKKNFKYFKYSKSPTPPRAQTTFRPAFIGLRSFLFPGSPLSRERPGPSTIL
jgi:hypothetical protein